MRRTNLATRILPTAGVLLLACSGSGTGPGTGGLSLAVLSGDRQTGLQHTALPESLVFQVTRRNGDAVAGARVQFTPGGGSGRVLEADSVTDEEGKATVRWELGDAWENRLVFSVPEFAGIVAEAGAWARYRYEPPEETGDGWETASLDAVGLALEPLTRLADSLRTRQYGEVHSVVIVKDGKVAFEMYFGGYDFGYSNPPSFHGPYVDFNRDTRHNTHSATKSIVSALVGLAIDQGLIASEHQRVFSFFDDYGAFNVGGKDGITIEHLLTMTSGLEWHEWDAPHQSGGNSIDAYLQAGDPTGYVLSMPLIHPPGAVFNYNGGGVNLLCRIVERVSGLRVDAFADRYLFQPMGVSNYNFPPYVTPIFCSGDIHLRPRDMARFGQLYLDGGMWGEDRVLSEQWVERSLAPLISVRDFHLGWAEDYGYLWWLNETSVGGTTYATFKALGWGGQEIWVVPQEDLVVAFTGANYSTNPPCDHLMARFVFPALEGA